MRRRLIVVVNFAEEGPVTVERVTTRMACFEIQEHRIGWDFKLGEEIIRRFDGVADAFAFNGLRKSIKVRNHEISHPGFERFENLARRTPLYYGEEMLDFLTGWTLRQVIRDQPQIFKGKKALFQYGALSAALPVLEDAGAIVQGADLLFFFGISKRLAGSQQVWNSVRLTSPLMRVFESRQMKQRLRAPSSAVMKTFQKWVNESDIIMMFSHDFNLLTDWSCLRGKIALVDKLSPELREKLGQAGVSQIVEFMPAIPGVEKVRARHFCTFSAILDQYRLMEDSPLSFEDYSLQTIEKMQVKPNRLKSAEGIERRCAFIIHPLAQNYLWKIPAARSLAHAPKMVRDLIEVGASRLPVFHYGEVRGVVSQSTGQVVNCDVYALLATPKQLLKGNEEQIYSQLVKAAELAQRRGAMMIGLGAYTKIVGDAGVTVSKRSPIPVTTGNSFSASTTLWAARLMMEKMALIPMDKDGERFRAKAMIIGATGSIGRVSALLVSLICREVVLVATTPDKLVELQAEVKALSPDVKVTITTSPNHELSDTDLIVTATSNQSGSILDILRVKPGAVICDCSRPLDITAEEAASRPDVMVVQSGEVILPGNYQVTADIGLPKPTVWACLAETVLLTMEGRYESFSLSKRLSLERVKEIYRIALKHGARLSEIQGHEGVITDEQIMKCRALAVERLKSWTVEKPGLIRSEKVRIARVSKKIELVQ